MMKKMQGQWKDIILLGVQSDLENCAFLWKNPVYALKIQTVQTIWKFQKIPIELKDTKEPRPSKRSQKISSRECLRV